MGVPELSGPAELYYNDKESQKYNSNTRVTKIQREMTLRALELLAMPAEPCTILDLGCGSGLSGRAINELGHRWVGVDISPAMLAIAQSQTQSLGLLRCDLGIPLPFQKESFDYAVSISAVQWLFQSYATHHYPLSRVRTFFRSLYSTVAVRAVIQVYCSKKELDILTKEARLAGFSGGMIVDNEGTKNVKHFLVLDKYHQKPVAIKKKLSRSAKKRALVE